MSKNSKSVKTSPIVNVNAAAGATVNISFNGSAFNGAIINNAGKNVITGEFIKNKQIERIEKAAIKEKEIQMDPQKMLSEKMTGKMEYMSSINTSCRGSDTICQKRIANAIRKICSYGIDAAAIIGKYLLPGDCKGHISAGECMKRLNALNVPVCICIFCYADAMQKCKANIEIKGRAVLDYLSSEREPEELPIVNSLNSGHLCDGSAVMRFESFGDTQNAAQAENYWRIAEKNPGVMFTIWTKNPGLYHLIYKRRGYKKPENIIMILSSEYLNAPDLKKLAYYDRFAAGLFDYLFTVWTVAGAKAAGVSFNCCAPDKENKCYKCGHCYRKGGERFVNEILKQDAASAGKA